MATTGKTRMLHLRTADPQPQALAIGGTNGPETLDGTPTDDQINGAGGDDILNGLGGNDRLYGGSGADRTDGGLGDDWHFVDNAADVVVEAAGEGNDRIFASASYTLTAGAEVELFSTSWHDGTGAINLTGNELANLIYGNAGNNILNGGAGADVLVGNGGIDIYYVDHADDYIVDHVEDFGVDRVLASVSYTLTAGARIEMLTTTAHRGTAAIDLTGNEYANIIYGNDGANVLNGGGGNDTLYGEAGNDIFRASAGDDAYYGGAGDDSFYVNDVLDAALDLVGQGNDRLFTSVSYTLRTGASIEIFSTDNHGGTEALELTGNDQANAIYGNAGDNILDGKGGNDVLIGWGGADTFAFTTQPRIVNPTNIDKIQDFEAEIDRIGLDDAIFAGIGAPGAFNADAFVVGVAAADAGDRIIYNNGALYYDPDGLGGQGQRLFAILIDAPALTANDFIVL